MGSQIDRKNPRKKMVQIELKFNVPSMRNLSSKSEKQSHVTQRPVRHLTSLNPRLPSMHASACFFFETHASACWSPHVPALSIDMSPWSTSNACIQHVRLNTHAYESQNGRCGFPKDT